jgi:hypothetical protein
LVSRVAEVIPPVQPEVFLHKLGFSSGWFSQMSTLSPAGQTLTDAISSIAVINPSLYKKPIAIASRSVGVHMKENQRSPLIVKETEVSRITGASVSSK